MEPQDFFVTAAAIEAQLPSSEANSRAVVNRLYYGCHHEAARYLGYLGSRTPGHLSVIEELSSRVPRASDDLRVLRSMREDADYRLATEWPVARSLVARARADRLRALIGTQ